MEILPFEDSIVVAELDGRTLWEAFESSLSTWPAQEGCVQPEFRFIFSITQACPRRFPVISGLRVVWDSRKQPGQRVLNIALQVHKKIDEHSAGDSTPNLRVEYEEVPRTSDRKYAIITREYMAEGHDGFEMLKGQKLLIDDEQGQMMSTIVRKYLLGREAYTIELTVIHCALGSKYINKMNKPESPKVQHLYSDTDRLLQSAKASKDRLTRQASARAREHWQHTLERIRAIVHSPAHYRAPFNIACREHMSSLDCCDGARVRSASGGTEEKEPTDDDDDLLEISPVVDGRLKNVGKAMSL